MTAKATAHHRHNLKAPSPDPLLAHIADIHHVVGDIQAKLSTLQHDQKAMQRALDAVHQQISYWKGGLAVGIGILAALTGIVSQLIH